MSEDFTITSTVTLNNGVEMERFGLGVWQAENGEATPAVAAAIKNGYRLIDTAKAYGNEADVRTGIEQGIAEAGIHVKIYSSPLSLLILITVTTQL